MLIPPPIAASSGAQAIISPPYDNGATPEESRPTHQEESPHFDSISRDEKLALALDYAARGWPVFPVPPGKKESYKSKKYSGGVNWGASTDSTQIHRDFARWPQANIGIRCGKDAGVFVVDVDTLDGHGRDGLAELDRLTAKHGSLPQTVEAISPTGSRHFYFSYPVHTEVKNSESKVAPGIDVRGEGGMVIAAPSVKPEYPEPYHWVNAPGLVDIAECPDWLLGLATALNDDGKPKAKRASSAGHTITDDDAVLGWLYERHNTLSREDWVRLGLALKDHFSDRARDAFLSFSNRFQGDISEGEAERQWDTSNPDGSVKIATAVHLLGGNAGVAGGPAESPVEDDCMPADLWAKYDAPDLPVGLLPPLIEAFARKQAEVMGTDPAGVAMACLTVCAAAIPDGLKVQVKRHDQGWTQSARLWTALVGNPSAKKTPAINAASAPLKLLDSTLFKRYAAEQEDYDALPVGAKKGKTPPQQRRHLLSDTTIEATQEVLKSSPDGIICLQDELGAFFGSMDKYSSGKGSAKDRGFWLQSYDGGTYAVNRVSRGASLIENLSVSLLGGIQPEPMRKIVSDSVDDGLIQRIIPVILKPAKVGMDVPTGPVNEAYDGLILALTQINPPSYALRYSEEAQCIRDQAEVKHHGLLLAEELSGKLASHFGKYDGIFARLSVLWHAIENAGRPMPDRISVETTTRVRDFLHGFILPSSIAFYTGVLGLSDDHDTLIELAGFILASNLQTVQHRDTQRASRSLKALSADQSRRLFEKLEAFGWVTATASPSNSNTPRWAVNPHVHEVFARRAKAERARRETVRAELANIFAQAA